MKVLLITGSLPPMHCGVGDYTYKLAEALVRQGVEVAILTGCAGTADGTSGFDPEIGGNAVVSASGITIFPMMPHWRMGAAPVAWRVLRKWRADVVHVQFPTQGYGTGRLPSFLPLMARLAGSRIVRTWHETPSGKERTFLLQAAVPGTYVVTRQSFGSAMPMLARMMLKMSRRIHVPIASNIPVADLTEVERDRLRTALLGGDGKLRLVVYFGFLYRFKGADQLFDICDPDADRLIFVGDAEVDHDYVEEIRHRATDGSWKGKASVLGYRPEAEIARILAAADAVVLPFHRGADIGNGTVHAATLQGTPVVTTSRMRRGLAEGDLVYYAPPGDVASMREGLDLLTRRRRTRTPADRDEWELIASAHRSIYTPARAA